jgi:hypothetical protein
MEDYLDWIYMGVMSAFVGGAMKKVLASHVSAAPTVVAWLGANVVWPMVFTSKSTS